MSFVSTVSAIDIGKQAPDFELYTIDRNKFVLSEHFRKKPVYLVFWATWCPVCRAEIPALIKIHQQFGEAITFLAINVGQDDSIKKVRKYQEDYQLPYKLAFDQGSIISRMYGVVGTPWQVIIDVNGKIRYRGSHTPENLEQHMETLTQLDKH